MIISVSFWAAIRQLQIIVMYFYGRGLGRIRHSSGTHHVVKLFEISEMFTGADKFVFENLPWSSLKRRLQCLLV